MHCLHLRKAIYLFIHSSLLFQVTGLISSRDQRFVRILPFVLPLTAELATQDVKLLMCQ